MRGRIIKVLICTAMLLMILVACSSNDQKTETDTMKINALYLEYEHDPDIRGGAVKKEEPKDNISEEEYSKNDSTDDNSDKSPDGETEYERLTVSVSSVNIRTAPSLDAEIISNVKWGTELKCVEKGETWHKIWYNESDAYVYAAYVKGSVQ